MSALAFDTITRRASVLALGGVGATVAGSSPEIAVARKKRKNARKKCKKKARRRCSSISAECRADVAAVGPSICGADPDCIAQITACCDDCSADGFLTCLFVSVTSVASVSLG